MGFAIRFKKHKQSEGEFLFIEQFQAWITAIVRVRANAEVVGRPAHATLSSHDYRSLLFLVNYRLNVTPNRPS